MGDEAAPGQRFRDTIAVAYANVHSKAARASHTAAQLKWRGGKGADYEAARNVRRKARKRAFVDALKVGAVCTKCGSDGPLHFHHRVPSTKLFPVSRCLTRSWEKIRAEVAKCDLLCVPCHKATHA